MERCPHEILFEIFKLACDDGGWTGRALSQVSRLVNQLSREYKLQSVAVIGIQRLVPFVKTLESLPEHHRRVRHIFISSLTQYIPSLEGSTRQARIPDTMTYDGTCSAYARIMELIAPTVVSCTLVTHIPRTTTLLPISCPNLVEVTMQGPFPVLLYPNDPPSFPSLRYATFSSFTDYPEYLFEDIAAQAPHLQHLAFYPARPSINLHGDLCAALDIHQLPGRSSRPPGFVHNATLPPSVTQVLVQPGPRVDGETRNASCLKTVQNLMSKKIQHLQKHDQRKRVKLVRPGRPQVHEKGFLEWLERRAAY